MSHLICNDRSIFLTRENSSSSSISVGDPIQRSHLSFRKSEKKERTISRFNIKRYLIYFLLEFVDVVVVVVVVVMASCVHLFRPGKVHVILACHILFECLNCP